MEKANKKKKIEHWQIMSLYLIIYDLVAVNAAYFLALLLRFDFRFSSIPSEYFESYLIFAPVYSVFCIGVFYMLRMYKSIWRYASINELNRIAISSVITAVFHTVVITIMVLRMPISYYMFGALAQFCMIAFARFSFRYVNLQRNKLKKLNQTLKNTMVIGAGEAGKIIINEMKNSTEGNSKICCIIDDNSNKWGRFLLNVPVVGGRNSIFENVEKYKINQILIAIPSLSVSERKQLVNLCNETGCEVLTLPGVYQIANGEVLLSKMRPVNIEDLLGREEIKVNDDEIFNQIRGKIILVTGGGGSIGSELCRQIAKHEPKLLVIFDIYENNAYDIEQELKRSHPELDMKVLIGSVRDSRRIEWVFDTYKPDVVYHAAAHKHVPLMESSPNEAIKNNVIGTYKTAIAALKSGTEKFVLISTDKAVNPTNIMGASKRLCEMVIQSLDKIRKDGSFSILPALFAHSDEDEKETRENISEGKTKFVAVRFGNVLGSNGSVIPLFKKQIEAGGPVTVTHPDIVRYFMTIPEAVSLVLEAGYYAEGGEIFVLDMGEPVKIDTLARNLIRLSGYEPDKDITLVYTGLRPGEKLYEERLMEEEGLKKTANELISIGNPIPFDEVKFMQQLKVLTNACYENSENIVDKVAEVVKTYHSAN